MFNNSFDCLSKKHDVDTQLAEEFNKKYRNLSQVKNPAKCVGYQDIMDYPDTKLHRKLNPHLYNFNFYGFKCEIVRNSTRKNRWWAIVDVPLTHPMWKNSMDDLSEPYEDESHPYVKELVCYGDYSVSPSRDKIALSFWNKCDLSPFVYQEPRKIYDVIYKDREFVINEVKLLCVQLYLLLPNWTPQNHSHFPQALQKKFWNIYKLWYLRKSSSDLSKIVEKDLWVKIINLSCEFEKKKLFMKFSFLF